MAEPPLEGLQDAFWTCPSCFTQIPWGSAHICSAQSRKDKTIPIYPSQLSIVEINTKLDLILDEVKKIKKGKI